MHRPESIDALLRYRAVLVANAVRALNEVPVAVNASYAVTRARPWQDTAVATGAWRSVAVAAGAVSQD